MIDLNVFCYLCILMWPTRMLFVFDLFAQFLVHLLTIFCILWLTIWRRLRTFSVSYLHDLCSLDLRFLELYFLSVVLDKLLVYKIMHAPLQWILCEISGAKYGEIVLKIKLVKLLRKYWIISDHVSIADFEAPKTALMQIPEHFKLKFVQRQSTVL